MRQNDFLSYCKCKMLKMLKKEALTLVFYIVFTFLLLYQNINDLDNLTDKFEKTISVMTNIDLLVASFIISVIGWLFNMGKGEKGYPGSCINIYLFERLSSIFMAVVGVGVPIIIMIYLKDDKATFNSLPMFIYFFLFCFFLSVSFKYTAKEVESIKEETNKNIEAIKEKHKCWFCMPSILWAISFILFCLSYYYAKNF